MQHSTPFIDQGQLLLTQAFTGVRVVPVRSQATAVIRCHHRIIMSIHRISAQYSGGWSYARNNRTHLDPLFAPDFRGFFFFDSFQTNWHVPSSGMSSG
jgi:hypothetical protein